MKKVLIIWITLFAILAPLLSSKVFADSGVQYIPKYMFFKNGKKYEKNIDFTLSCYGKDHDPYTGETSGEISLQSETDFNCEDGDCEYLSWFSLKEEYCNIDIESADGDKMSIEKFTTREDFLAGSEKLRDLNPPDDKVYVYEKSEGMPEISSFIVYAFDIGTREMLDLSDQDFDIDSVALKDQEEFYGNSEDVSEENDSSEVEESVGSEVKRKESGISSSDSSEGSKDYFYMLEEESNKELKNELNSMIWRFAYIYVIAFVLGLGIGVAGAYYIITKRNKK